MNWQVQHIVKPQILQTGKQTKEKQQAKINQKSGLQYTKSSLER